MEVEVRDDPFNDGGQIAQRGKPLGSTAEGVDEAFETTRALVGIGHRHRYRAVCEAVVEPTNRSAPGYPAGHRRDLMANA
jgi:hypothetical protein